MAYIVNQDIIDKVGNAKAAQLTTDSGTVPSATVLDKIRLSAEGEVNGYIGRRYAVPIDLTAHPDLAGVLEGYTLDIAVYRLHAERPPAPQTARDQRDDAIKWLEGIAKGTIALPGATTPESTNANEPAAAWGSQSQNASELRNQ